MGTVVVTMKAHPVNAWFLRLFARPYVSVDADETRLGWRRPYEIRVSQGPHRLTTFIRYPPLAVPLGCGSVVVSIGDDLDRVDVLSTNGPLNHQAFIPRARP